MENIIKKLKVKDRIVFYIKSIRGINKTKIQATVKCLGNKNVNGYNCNGCICVERDDGTKGGGCEGGWILNNNESNWGKLNFMYFDNPNSNIKVRKTCWNLK